MDRLNINEKDRRSAQFLVEDNNGKYEALPDPISYTRLNALLNSGVTVFVDSQGAIIQQETSSNNGATRAGTRYSA